MAGFIRRFQVFPPLNVITAIEGIDIIDLIPPGVFLGVGTGTVCLVGEWPKGPYNAPTQVTGDDVIRGTFGGFSLSVQDYLGVAFAANPYSNGNSFTWLKGKTFQRLVLVRPDVHLTSAFVTITLSDSTTSSVSGAKTVAVGPPATITDPNAHFRSSFIGLTITTTLFTNPGNNGTFPIVAPTGGTTISFTNPGAVAEVSPVGATWTIVGVTLPADVTIPGGTRVFNPGSPTQVFALAQDVTFLKGTTYAAAIAMNQTVYSVTGIASAGAATVTSVNTNDLYNAGIGPGTGQPFLVVTSSNTGVLTPLTQGQMDAAYIAAFTSTAPTDDLTTTINVLASARESSNIRTGLLAEALAASAVGGSRVAVIRPSVGTNAATAEGSGDPGVGANRSDRAFYCYPHYSQFIEDLGASVLVGADAAMACTLSNFAPEDNPGHANNFIQYIQALEPGLTTIGQATAFQESDYEAFKAAGICALRKDRAVGWVFQSGVTSVDPVAFPSLTTIKRRRMADFIQDSLAVISLQFNKFPATEDRKDSLVGEHFAFLNSLLSPNNPATQRIVGFVIDTITGNTPDLEALGIFVVKTKVRILPSLDFIVLQTTIGENVDVTAIVT